VEGRGFLSKWEHAEELERLEEEKAVAAPKPKKPMTWAERVLAGTK
jgi:hypothetical protein